LAYRITDLRTGAVILACGDLDAVKRFVEGDDDD